MDGLSPGWSRHILITLEKADALDDTKLFKEPKDALRAAVLEARNCRAIPSDAGGYLNRDPIQMAFLSRSLRLVRFAACFANRLDKDHPRVVRTKATVQSGLACHTRA